MPEPRIHPRFDLDVLAEQAKQEGRDLVKQVAEVERDPTREVVASYSNLATRDEARWRELDASLDDEQKALALLTAPGEATGGPADEWAELTRARFPVAVVR